jgi:hypothetical protein
MAIYLPFTTTSVPPVHAYVHEYVLEGFIHSAIEK